MMRLAWPWARRPPQMDPERARQIAQAATFTSRAARLAEEIERSAHRLELLLEDGKRRDGKAHP